MSDQVGSALKIIVVCPHFEPDTAPTGVVITRIVHELVALGHEVHVLTALPWYRQHRVEDLWRHIRWNQRTTVMPWGSVTRLNPFAGTDKRNLLRRAYGFLGFSFAVVMAGARINKAGRPDAIIAMSPPLTLGLSGWIISLLRRAPLIFNIQDVFPDAAIETGAITNKTVIRLAQALEKFSYRRAAIITVLSEDMRQNVLTKLPISRSNKVVVIANFVDTDVIVPLDRLTEYRRDLGIDDRPVVMYAGNVGFSQSLQLVLQAARVMPEVAFVINGDGAAKTSLQLEAQGLANVIFTDYQPAQRLSEVLATADIHLVLLRRGLGRVSVPSKIYSIMAAGRPVLAAIDADTEVPRLLQAAQGGIAVAPDDPKLFIQALGQMLSDMGRTHQMGCAARSYVEGIASPCAIAKHYAEVISDAVDAFSSSKK